MRLYVIRHGETEWNAAKKLQGQSDVMLNEEGVRLAKATGAGMKNLSIDLAFTSPLARTKDTAKYVLGNRNIPLIEDERIKEISFGVWEGECIENSEILSDDFPELFLKKTELYVPPEGGESFSDVLKRTGEFCEELIRNTEYRDKNILISTHGCAGRCFLNYFCEDKIDIWLGGVPGNCTVSIVEVENGVGKIVEQDKSYF